MRIGMGYWHFSINTEYYRVNLQMNEGGRWVTFGIMLWQPDYRNVVASAGMIRLWLFGKEFLYWVKKK